MVKRSQWKERLKGRLYKELSDVEKPLPPPLYWTTTIIEDNSDFQKQSQLPEDLTMICASLREWKCMFEGMSM